MEFPESRVRKAVSAESSAETEKLFAALNKIKEEDPTLKVDIDHETHEAILGGQGQLHIDLVFADEFSLRAGVKHLRRNAADLHCDFLLRGAASPACAEQNQKELVAVCSLVRAEINRQRNVFVLLIELKDWFKYL